MLNLTDTFKQHVDNLREYYYSNNSIPSFTEAMDVFGIKSKGALSYIFTQLQEYWLIEKIGKKFAATDKLIWIPYYESVQAWLPTEVTTSNEYETMNINSMFVQNPSKTMIVRVTWSSMKDIGIRDGDMVVVDTWKQATLWDLVIATTNDGNTLKILTKDKQWRLCLEAANAEEYTDYIYPEVSLSIVGVVVGSFRLY